MADKKIAVIAIGGNSLIKDSKHQSVEDQYEAAKETCKHIADMIEAGYEVVIGHGNGPQVGAQLIRSESAAAEAYRLPLDCCVASTQGEIGYVLQYAMWQMMQAEGLDTPDLQAASAKRSGSGEVGAKRLRSTQCIFEI